jgi:hypothetical protein
VNTGVKIAEVRVSKRAVYLGVFVVGIPVTLALLALAEVLGHYRLDLGLMNLVVALVLFIPLAAVHELLHAAAALLWGRVRPRDMQIAVHWKAGALACRIKVPIRVGATRIVGLTPLVVTGPLMLGFLLKYPSEVTALLAGMTLLGCAMDLVMIYKLRRFDPNLLVVDHPTEPAFDIYAPQTST